jgi:hypothetical protein
MNLNYKQMALMLMQKPYQLPLGMANGLRHHPEFGVPTNPMPQSEMDAGFHENPYHEPGVAMQLAGDVVPFRNRPQRGEVPGIPATGPMAGRYGSRWRDPGQVREYEGSVGLRPGSLSPVQSQPRPVVEPMPGRATPSNRAQQTLQSETAGAARGGDPVAVRQNEIMGKLFDANGRIRPNINNEQQLRNEWDALATGKHPLQTRQADRDMLTNLTMGQGGYSKGAIRNFNSAYETLSAKDKAILMQKLFGDLAE